MALVACRECGNRVASSAKACPNCGIDYPGGAGKLVLVRRAAITGSMYSVKVGVDGQPAGEIRNGSSLVVNLLAGDHQVAISGGGMSDSTFVTICDGQDACYELSFSALGLLGGGLKLRPA